MLCRHTVPDWHRYVRPTGVATPIFAGCRLLVKEGEPAEDPRTVACKFWGRQRDCPFFEGAAPPATGHGVEGVLAAGPPPLAARPGDGGGEISVRAGDLRRTVSVAALARRTWIARLLILLAALSLALLGWAARAGSLLDRTAPLAIAAILLAAATLVLSALWIGSQA